MKTVLLALETATPSVRAVQVPFSLMSTSARLRAPRPLSPTPPTTYALRYVFQQIEIVPNDQLLFDVRQIIVTKSLVIY